MVPTLLLTAALAAGPVDVTVEVVEFYTQKPVVGAKVTLKETSGTAVVSATTAAKGKARFTVPHLDFEFVEATRRGYLTPAELAPWRAFLKQAYLDRKTRRGDDELHFQAWLVPEGWVEQNVKVRTKEQAAAIANEWAAPCAQGGPTSLELQHQTWVATYPCMDVRIGMESGEAYPKTPDVPSATPLYAPAEALADALGSPLKHVGTVVWPGQFRIPSCVYRNATVFVVNDYCTLKEITSTGVKVFHPQKGVAGFYAEAKEPISTIGREDYGQWTFGSTTAWPGLRLDMTLKELIAYETHRAKLAKGMCSAGLQYAADKNGSCHLKTPEISQWWDGVYKPLLKAPPPGWFELVKLLRQRARKDGKPDPRGE